MPYEIPTRWPLVQTLSNREADLLKDARLINAYAEMNPQQKSYSVKKRPGIITSGDLVATGLPQGIFMFQNTLVKISGSTAYRNSIPLGTVYSQSFQLDNFYTANFTTNDAGFMMLSRPEAAYWLFSFTLRQITDPNYPVRTVPGIGYVNGRFYVMDENGVIYGAKNLDDPTTWDPLNTIVAQQSSGNGVYLAQQLTYLVALKSKSAEVFWDSGQTATSDGTGSTLQPIIGATVPYGCWDAGTVLYFDGTLIWMTSSEAGTPQIGRMDNLQFQIISTPSVERLIKGTVSRTCRCFALKLGGHRFYVLQFRVTATPDPSTGYTLVYDLDQKIWSVWTDTDGVSAWPFYSSTAYGESLPSQSLPATNFIQRSDGRTYIAQEDYITPNDLGLLIPVDIYTPNYDADTDREKFMPALYFDADIVPGSKLAIRYSDDDYATWTTPQELSLAYRKPKITDLGSFYRRAFHFRHLCNTPLRITSVGMDLGLGTL